MTKMKNLRGKLAKKKHLPISRASFLRQSASKDHLAAREKP
jgi:hypothetical protein